MTTPPIPTIAADDPPASVPPGRRVEPKSTARMTLLGLLVVVLIAYGGWTWWARSRAAQADAAAAARAASDRIIPVLTAFVAQRDVPVWREGLGSVVAFYTVTVKPQVDGRLEKVLFAEGQQVKKGEALAQIDARPFAVQLRTAEATLARDVATLRNDQVNRERYRTLSAQHLIPEQQLTDQDTTVAQLEAQVHGDQAQVDAARLNMDYARITSPIDGVTGMRLVDPGNIVHASDPNGLVIVTQLDPVAVLFTLPEDDLPAITRARAEAATVGERWDGTPGRVAPEETASTAGAQGALVVEARSRDGDNALGQGKLTVIDNQINQSTATVRLKAIFANPRQALWPNQFVRARLRLATRRNAIVVPAAAVQRGPQGPFAYVVDSDARAAVRPVVVDSLEGELAIIARGLSPGEQVVVEGQAQLRPGSKVSPKAAPSAATVQSTTRDERTP
ncbi:MAG: efflux RND transporter periplasmic adaptor subunit [Myxococcota bacterium]|nr:efflux RND transporter periplasmic adaptor subunit [Myxococcota bacterium]